MNSRIISQLERSQLAKNAGCKLPNLTVYPETLLHEWTFTPEEKKKSEYISILTNTIIQKWLREEKFYHVYVIPVTGNKWVYEVKYISLVMDDFISYLLIEQEEYSTYEEALEAGLTEALKQI